MGRKKLYNEEENYKRQLERNKVWQQKNKQKHCKNQKNYYEKNKLKIKERRRIKNNFGYNVNDFFKDWKIMFEGYISVAKGEQREKLVRSWRKQLFPPSSYRYISLGYFGEELAENVKKYRPKLCDWKLSSKNGRIPQEVKINLLKKDKKWFMYKENKPDEKYYKLID